MLLRSAAMIPVVFCLFGCSADNPADRLARRVFLAAGADNWEDVRSLSFTITRPADAIVKTQRAYRWDRAAGTLTVVENGKSSAIDLADTTSRSCQAWLDDSFWLLAPFQLFDAGVTRTYGGVRTLSGTRYEILEVSLPSRHCILYINPRSDRIEASEVSILNVPLTTAWDSPRDVGGLVFATTHRSAADPDVILAQQSANNAKTLYDQAVASVSQGFDPPGVDQLLPVLYPVPLNHDALRIEEYKALELRLGKDNPQFQQIMRREEQERQTVQQEQGEARARAKIQILEQYKQMAEAEMCRVEAMKNHQGLTIDITDIQLTRD